jgi:hypothetical protein
MGRAVCDLEALLEIAGCFAFWMWLRHGRSPTIATARCFEPHRLAALLTRVDAAFAGQSCPKSVYKFRTDHSRDCSCRRIEFLRQERDPTLSPTGVLYAAVTSQLRIPSLTPSQPSLGCAELRLGRRAARADMPPNSYQAKAVSTKPAKRATSDLICFTPVRCEVRSNRVPRGPWTQIPTDFLDMLRRPETCQLAHLCVELERDSFTSSAAKATPRTITSAAH